MATKKGGLGRGIGALIPTSSLANERPIDVFFGNQPEAEAPEASIDADSALVSVPGVAYCNTKTLASDTVLEAYNFTDRAVLAPATITPSSVFTAQKPV